MNAYVRTRIREISVHDRYAKMRHAGCARATEKFYFVLDNDISTIFAKSSVFIIGARTCALCATRRGAFVNILKDSRALNLTHARRSA